MQLPTVDESVWVLFKYNILYNSKTLKIYPELPRIFPHTHKKKNRESRIDCMYASNNIDRVQCNSIPDALHWDGDRLVLLG